MECPRCRLMNPDTAERCDCGYDFQSGKVEKPYFEEKLEIPRWIPAVLGISGCLGSCRTAGETAVNGELPTGLVLISILIWWLVVLGVYQQLTKGQKWAKVVLVILTFPIGLAFLFSRKLDNFIRLRNDQNKTSTEAGRS